MVKYKGLFSKPSFKTNIKSKSKKFENLGGFKQNKILEELAYT